MFEQLAWRFKHGILAMGTWFTSCINDIPQSITMSPKNASEDAGPAGPAPTARQNPGVGPLHERIAADLRTAIVRGDHLPGTKLPTEAELARHYGAGRGTVRAALRAVEAEGLVTSRQGSGRVVLGGGVSQSFDELRSFAQWARATGHTPGGIFVTRLRRPAEAIEATALAVEPGSEVLYTVRLRTMDGTPVLVERCTYPGWLADTIAELDERCASVTAEVRRLTGMVAVSGTHTLDVTRADVIDSELLACDVGAPILRRRAITRSHDGVPLDYTDDHYAEQAASFTLHNSVTTNVLSRYIFPAALPKPRAASAT
jgi:GntR family transcriptional regulator